ncbi:hypothetical protein [Vulgatibacter sp.]|uniref:hypothetical protein n=1 Tax=Vulgatibacter sp. TaxID=1971226 RepID=UPI00356307D0
MVRLLLALLCFLLAACHTAPLRTSRFDPGAARPDPGAVYFLPETHLHVKWRLGLTLRPGATCATAVAGCGSTLDKRDVTVEGLEVEALSMPDREAGFVVASKKAALTRADFTGEFSDLGELTSTTSTAENQTVEIAAAGITAVGRIVKAVAIAGVDDGKKRIQGLAKRRDALRALLVALETKQDTAAGGGDEKRFTELGKVRTALLAELAAVEAELYPKVEAEISCFIDPAGPGAVALTPATCAEYGKVVAALQAAGLSGFGASTFPTVTVDVAHLAGPVSVDTGVEWLRLPWMDDCGDQPAPCVEGIVYRIPARFRITASADRGRTITRHLAIPQLGQLAVVTVDEGDVRPDQKLEVSLHPGLGSLAKISTASTPISAEDVERLSTAADALVRSPQAAELERLQTEAALLQAKAAVLEARTKLEDAEQAAE